MEETINHRRNIDPLQQFVYTTRHGFGSRTAVKERMQLQSFSIHNLGPFYEQFTLQLEKDVTILTGTNDAGKSCVLRFLKAFCGMTPIYENDVNEDFHHACQTSWKKSDAIRCRATFDKNQFSETLHPAFAYGNEDIVRAEVVWKAAPELNKFDVNVFRKHGGLAGQGSPNAMPACFMLGDTGKLRDVVELDKLTDLERHLLDVAFSPKFSLDKWSAIGNEDRRSRQLQMAENKLNSYVSRFLPVPSSLRFKFQLLGSDKNKLGVSLADIHGGLTPFSSRGTGARKMLTLLGEMIRICSSANQVLLLFDEPENSLHADAQHLLREFLFELGKRPNVQVVYATHSPAMLNPMRPESIRVLKRQAKGDIGITVLDNRPTANNFRAVRASLGLSAVDSLLFAPVSVIVEGDSECASLPLLFERAAAKQPQAFADYTKLLSLALFLEGTGQNWKNLALLANSHGSKVVVFLDGDMAGDPSLVRFQKEYPNIPVVLIPDKRAIEDLVLKPVYFQAVAKWLGKTEQDVNEKAFGEWDATRTYKSSFGTRVEYWAREKLGAKRFSKPEVMRMAADVSKPEDVDGKPLIELLAAIRSQLSNTSFG